MPQFHTIQFANGTRFIHHQEGSDRFVFEARGGHILSISISSPSISYYRELLDTSTYGASALDAGAGNVRHDAIHDVGVSQSLNHEHFSSKRNSDFDGIQTTALLIPKLRSDVVYQVALLAKTT